MRLFRDRQVLAALPSRIAALERALSSVKEHPRVGEVRQRGSMVGIELVRDRATREGYPPDVRAGHRACMEARPLGAILRPLGNVVVLMPPLSMTEPQLEELVAIALQGIDRATAKLG